LNKKERNKEWERDVKEGKKRIKMKGRRTQDSDTEM
jgi:hypothetical protein